MTNDAAHDRGRPTRWVGIMPCVLVCVALTLVLRIAWAAVVPFEPVSDSKAYFTFASHIASGQGYGWEPNTPSAYWAVGPSAIYGAAFALLGPGKLAVVLVNLVASGLMTAFAVILARRWFGDRFGSRAPWAAGLMHAIWPTSIMFTTVLNSEMMFGAALLGSLVVLFPATTERGVPGWRRWLLAGPILAATALIRPTGLLLAPITAGIHAARAKPTFAPRPTMSAGFRGVVCVVVMLACITPWTVRNYNAFGEFILISTNGGTNFWMGNNPDTDGSYMPPPDRTRGMTEHERSEVLKAEAIDFIRTEPTAFAQRTAIKLVKQHAYETIGVAWNEPALRERFGDWVLAPLKAAGSVFWWGTLAFAGFGWILIARTDGLWRAVTHPVFVLWGYFACVHAITVIQDRYHLQWSPMVMLLASPAVALLAGRVLGTRDRGV